MTQSPHTVGSVGALWRYPVKSLQGLEVDQLEVGTTGIVGDRAWGIVDPAADKVLSAKRVPELLEARALDDDVIELPTGERIRLGETGCNEALSAWLGRHVELRSSGGGDALAYEMTFDPPDDTAEVFAIPTPAGTFLDLAAVHLVCAATLAWCEERRPDLDFDVRRFRPNLVVTGDADAFAEDRWSGHQVRIGEVVVAVTQPTVRCAMPLRAQPAGPNGSPPLERQPDLHDALVELNEQFPNHLGVYAEVVTPGTIHVGDVVTVED